MKIGVYTLQKSGTHIVSDIISLMVDLILIFIIKKCTKKFYILDKSKIPQCTYFSTHLSYIDLEYLLSINTRLICVIRNPLDVCISMYFFYEMRKEQCEQRNIFDYVKQNIKRISEKTIDFYQRSVSNNKCLIVKFEDLITNIDNSLVKIYNFINKYNRLPTPKYELIKQKINFKVVQQEEKKNGIYKVGRIQKSLFHRSGKIGQSKEHFSKKKINQLLALTPRDF